jgi:integrative and conjugative element protein (TIGR02256 family)
MTAAPRCFFFKNKDEHQTVIDEKWEETKGTCNYLGEWHTHPEDHPTPSSIDIKTWFRLVKETKFEFGELYFIIVGRKSACAYKVNQRVNRLTSIHE